MRLLVILVGTCLLAFGGLACGDDDDDTDTGAGSPQDIVSSDETATIAVTETDGDIDLQTTLLPAGRVTFEVTNEGPSKHEFVIAKTDLQASSLPQKEGKVDEEAQGFDVVKEVEDIDSGDTETVAADLEPGHYVIICNVPGHYQLGMRVDVNVS
jgi:uncharacterized cupredoxin-like copper-binding protein